MKKYQKFMMVLCLLLNTTFIFCSWMKNQYMSMYKSSAHKSNPKKSNSGWEQIQADWKQTVAAVHAQGTPMERFEMACDKRINLFNNAMEEYASEGGYFNTSFTLIDGYRDDIIASKQEKLQNDSTLKKRPSCDESFGFPKKRTSFN